MQLAPDNRCLGHPIKLHHPAFTDMRSVSMERAGAATKRQHGPGPRHNLSDIIFDVIGPTQQAQTALGLIPDKVQIKQQCDDLGFGVGVNASVLAVATAAHRDHRRAVPKVEPEFFPDRVTQCRSGQIGNQRGKGRPACQALDRVTSVTRDLREVGDDRTLIVAADKVFDDNKVERVAAQRLRP